MYFICSVSSSFIVSNKISAIKGPFLKWIFTVNLYGWCWLTIDRVHPISGRHPYTWVHDTWIDHLQRPFFALIHVIFRSFSCFMKCSLPMHLHECVHGMPGMLYYMTFDLFLARMWHLIFVQPGRFSLWGMWHFSPYCLLISYSSVSLPILHSAKCTICVSNFLLWVELRLSCCRFFKKQHWRTDLIFEAKEEVYIIFFRDEFKLLGFLDAVLSQNQNLWVFSK